MNERWQYHLDLVNEALSYFGSRTALSEYLGVHKATISAWKMGRQEPRPDHILAMQKYIKGETK